MSAATVTVQYSEFQRLHEQVKELTAQVEIARIEADIARTEGAGTHSRQILVAFGQAIKIVQFANGNFTPLTVRGYPHEALRALAAALPDLAGIDESLREVATDWRLLADSYKTWEDARAEGKEHELLAHDNALKGASLDAFGPMLSGQAATPDD